MKPNRAIHFAMGFVGWFLFQTIYSSIAYGIGSTPLFIASLPINIIAILVLYLKKLRGIANGAGIAFVLNFIGIISLQLIGVLYEEGIGAIYLLFPPFFLLFTHWFQWLHGHG